MTHFPYEEDQAGILRDTHQTGKSSEYLLADEQILSLAKEILPESTYVEAESLARMLTESRSNKAAARSKLITILLPPPKRPIYYLPREIRSLPRWTRNAMRFLGDYVDMLVKAAAYEILNEEDILSQAFGRAIGRFEVAYPNETLLVKYLNIYNRFLYRVAKHDMKLPANRKEHRFTSREVVLCLFISRELANRVIAISKFAYNVNKDLPMA